MPKRVLLLVRHGATEWNAMKRFQGLSDTPLSDLGRKQAERVASRLADWGAEAILTSPLERASKTAHAICSAQKTPSPLYEWEDLEEMSFGAWEGLSIDEIRTGDPEGFERWKQDPFSFVPPQGETRDVLFGRSERVCRRIFEAGYARAIVVAHGGILRALLVTLLEIPCPEFAWRMSMDNCSLTEVVWEKERALLKYSNDTRHLEG